MPPKNPAARKKVKADELPELPDFQPKIRPHMNFHSRFITSGMRADVGNPGAILNEFISIEQFAIMAKHTNAYAVFQKAPRWKNTTVDELRIFMALLIFMGIYSFPAVVDYWKKDFELRIMKYMSLKRFQQIKRYFHVAALPKEGEEEPLWWMKVEPLASFIRSKCQELLVPSTQVAIDEMMVQFSGRSCHTVKMPNKPMACVIMDIPTTLPFTHLHLDTLICAIIILELHLPQIQYTI